MAQEGRVTRHAVEVLTTSTTDAPLRTTRTAVEVLASVATVPPPAGGTAVVVCVIAG